MLAEQRADLQIYDLSGRAKEKKVKILIDLTLIFYNEKFLFFNKGEKLSVT
jgi:hypothetical protein